MQGALLDERGPWSAPPRTPKNGSYDAAIPLLKRAFAAGARPEALVAHVPIVLPDRFSFHVEHDGGGYYAWFEKGLEGGAASDELWGAGRLDGETILRWDREEALGYAQARGFAPPF